VRVLLSAYACEPGKGSEQEVGWQRALHMQAHADEVWVLTRGNNKTVIEADSLSYAPGLHFIYYDLPAWALSIKKQSWFRPFYFIFWQWGAYRLAARHHRNKPFDAVYHVTIASMRFGSFMGRLGIPFVIGPIAGGEAAPSRLRSSMPIRSKAIELGADAALDPAATDLPDQVKSLTGNGFDLVFEASGAKAALRAAFDLVRPGGTIVQIGTLGTEDIPLPANQLMNREINYIGSMRYGDVFGEAIQLAASGRVNLQPIISSVLPFGKFVQGLHLAADKSNSFKVQIEL